MHWSFLFYVMRIRLHAGHLTVWLVLAAVVLSSPPRLSAIPCQSTAMGGQNDATAPPSDEIQIDPLRIAKVLAQKNMLFEAECTVREYLVNNTNSANGHFLLGEILFREIQVAERAKANPTDSRILRASPSDSSLRASKAKESLAAYARGARFRPPAAFDLKIIALDYVLLGDYFDADKWLTRSLELNPADPDAWYNLGRTKYNENRFAEAVGAFQHCLKLDPKNVKAADNLGLSFADLSRTTEAIAAYKNAIEWQSNLTLRNPGPYIDLGRLYIELNQFSEAVPYLLEAVRIAPLDAKAHEELGKAYSGLNQLADARLELEKAMALSSESASLHFLLSKIYRKEGLAEKAKMELDRAATLSGTHSVSETPRP